MPTIPHGYRRVESGQARLFGDAIWEGDRFRRLPRTTRHTEVQAHEFLIRRCDESTPDLFAGIENDSPRLRWLAENGLMTRKDELPRSYLGDQMLPWVCCRPAMTVCCFGLTEADSIWAWARRFGLKHYSVEDWDRAMGAVPARIIDEEDC